MHLIHDYVVQQFWFHTVFTARIVCCQNRTLGPLGGGAVVWLLYDYPYQCPSAVWLSLPNRRLSACVCMPACSLPCYASICLSAAAPGSQCCAPLSALLCVAYPPYASGRSLLLYCFRHWVHHPCPRPSAPRVWATKRKQAILLEKTVSSTPRILQFLQVYWSETYQCVQMFPFMEISSKEFLFWDV